MVKLIHKISLILSTMMTATVALGSSPRIKYEKKRMTPQQIAAAKENAELSSSYYYKAAKQGLWQFQGFCCRVLQHGSVPVWRCCNHPAA